MFRDPCPAFYNKSMHGIRAIIVLTLLFFSRSAVSQENQREIQFFEKKIRPVLLKSCYKCHSAKSKELGGKLRLDHRAGVLKGGETGPAIVPGNPKASLLLAAIEYRGGLEMPPDKKLPAEVIKDFRTWIGRGAADPRSSPTSEPGQDGRPQRARPSKDLWSLQPVTAPPLPGVVAAGWPRTPVDHFVLAKLEASGLKPVGDSAAATLLRRVHFDLVGLPPSPEEADAFQADHSLQAFTAVVDDLLASPRFGERWGRHWLDVVRFAESAGSSRDVLIPWAWRFRNYVIDAINADIPFDRFLTEQIAGDLLEAQTAGQRRRLQVATGLLAIGQKSLNGGNIPLDLIDDQIDVVGKAFLGLTISCARCHDHKFDPIPTADYYALAGIFRSTETLYGGGIGRPKNVQAKLKVYLALGDVSKTAELQKHQQQVNQLQNQRKKLAKRVKALQKKLPKNWKRRKTDLTGSGKQADQPTAPQQQSPGKTKKKKTKKPGKRPRAGGNKDAQFLKQVRQFETARDKLAQLAAQLKTLNKQKLPPLDFAVGVREAKKIADGPIQIRGEKNKTGQVVPRGFLTSVSIVDPPQITDKHSGRRELADWLSRPDHPLTPRVAVNRLWLHLFGRGLVSTVDNFGHNGRLPSHPALLDWLAHRFVHQHQWSRKALIRELVLSRTYALASTYEAAAYEIDPGASLYWRHQRRRLEAEAIRDTMLAVSGDLNFDRPVASQVTKVGEGEVGRNINIAPLTAPFPYRSVYLPIVRGIVPEFLKLFDFPDPSNPQGRREETNVPAQSLFLLNSPFVQARADGLAGRLLDGSGQPADRVRRAYQITLSRNPASTEVERAVEFLESATKKLADEKTDVDKQNQKTPRQRAWSLLCQALLAGAEFRYVD